MESPSSDFSDPVRNSGRIENVERSEQQSPRPISNGADFKTKFENARRFSPLQRIEGLLHTFSPGERLMLYVLAAIMALSAVALVALVNRSVSINVPAAGGSLTEGVIGPARFINPVLTMSEADEEITQLVYSGLTRPSPDGSVVPDLASRYEISEDGTVYTFTIRENARFHDGERVTSADIAYTVARVQDPAIKSPRRADWEGVVVSTPDSRTVVFTLPRSYAPFLENTSMGILPQHLWQETNAEEFPFNPLNTKPIGSGPFKISNVETGSTGSPISYTLVPFKKYTLGAPFLQKITLLFYPNDEAMIDAFNAGEINAIAGVTPEQLTELKRSDVQIISVALPRIFGVFFNQNRAAALSDAAARRALEVAIDKDRLVSMVLSGYGVPLNGPMLPSEIAEATTTQAVSTAYTQESIAAARGALSAGGWKFDEASGAWTKGAQTLTFSLATADAPELVKTADAIATAWRQAGVKVTVQVYPIAELNSSIIRPRSYDAILFGEVIGRSLDLFAFWHSSQRNDPGLNLSLYANSRADTVLAQARATTNRIERDKLYSQFAEILAEDRPAVFLYAPEFVYVVPKQLQGVSLGTMTIPADRFLWTSTWYMDTEHVWSIFTNRSDNSVL